MTGRATARRKNVSYRQTQLSEFISKSSDKPIKASPTAKSSKPTTPPKKQQQTKSPAKKPLDIKPASNTAKIGSVKSKKGTQAFKAPDTSPAGSTRRPNLKRKGTGTSMFSSVWTRGAQRDTEDYRNGYPGKTEHPNWTENYDFYMNELCSKPDGDYIDNIHANWWGDYDRLEIHHGYIQWLFPIRESGMNWHAQELQVHEIDKIMKNKKALKRILNSYKMMLDFYGMKLVNEKNGQIQRADNWKERFSHLNRSYHNYLRITRILKCLGEFGYEHLKANFIRFVLHEGLAEKTLSNVINSCVKYWIGVLKDDDERNEVLDYYEDLCQRYGEDEDEEDYYWSKKSSFLSTWSGSSNSSDKVKKIVVNDDTAVGKKVPGKSTMGSNKSQQKAKKLKGDEEEFSDDEDGTLEYGMSLIDDSNLGTNEGSENTGGKGGSDKTKPIGGKIGGKLAGKGSKEHEMSDSDDGEEFTTPNETPGSIDEPDRMEESQGSQEMSYWNMRSGSKVAKYADGASHHHVSPKDVADDLGLGSEEYTEDVEHNVDNSNEDGVSGINSSIGKTVENEINKDEEDINAKAIKTKESSETETMIKEENKNNCEKLKENNEGADPVEVCGEGKSGDNEKNENEADIKENDPKVENGPKDGNNSKEIENMTYEKNKSEAKIKENDPKVENGPKDGNNAKEIENMTCDNAAERDMTVNQETGDSKPLEKINNNPEDTEPINGNLEQDTVVMDVVDNDQDQMDTN